MTDHFTEDRVAEIGRELFRAGAQIMRELLLKRLLASGLVASAYSLGDIWSPGWGDDPGPPGEDRLDRAVKRFDVWDWTP